MKRIYRGHEIRVERTGTIMDEDALDLSITRMDDGYLLVGKPYYGSESVREMIGQMKDRVDNEIADSWDEERSRGTYEPRPEDYDLNKCFPLPDHLQQQLPEKVRVRMKMAKSDQ